MDSPAATNAPMPSVGSSASRPDPAAPRGLAAQAGYLRVLTWSFTIFNAVRVISYLPTLWAIVVAGNSQQHSLWTWCTWLGANATMAAWLYEGNGRRMDSSVLVNSANAFMCAATVVVIVACRVQA